MEKDMKEEGVALKDIKKEPLTQEEKELIVKILTNVPLQGNIQTLPKTMEGILSILRKLS